MKIKSVLGLAAEGTGFSALCQRSLTWSVYQLILVPVRPSSFEVSAASPGPRDQDHEWHTS